MKPRWNFHALISRVWTLECEGLRSDTAVALRIQLEERQMNNLEQTSDLNSIRQIYPK